MIARLIEASARNPVLVILSVLLLAIWGGWAALDVPLDAIPDLSDVQVIVYTEWQGRSPTLIEDQITYPVVTALLAGPRVKRVRGVSEYGVSYVYVIFEDRTDLYWARSRVLEYLQKLWWTSREPMTWRSSAVFRIGTCVTNLKACQAWRKSQRSVDSSNNTKSKWTPTH